MEPDFYHTEFGDGQPMDIDLVNYFPDSADTLMDNDSNTEVADEVLAPPIYCTTAGMPERYRVPQPFLGEKETDNAKEGCGEEQDR